MTSQCISKRADAGNWSKQVEFKQNVMAGSGLVSRSMGKPRSMPGITIQNSLVYTKKHNQRSGRVMEEVYLLNSHWTPVIGNQADC